MIKHFAELESKGCIFASDLCQLAGKAVCVTRNYQAHALELGNPVPSQPVFFNKSANCFVPMAPSLCIPVDQGPCHYELEVVFVMAQALTPSLARAAPLGELIAAVGLGIDLTLREVQQGLKSASLPWERAKSFDGAAPLTQAVSFSKVEPKLDSLGFELKINNQERQQGFIKDMIFGLRALLIEISQFMRLSPGDLLFSGTPEGVGPLSVGDRLEAKLFLNDLKAPSPIPEVIFSEFGQVVAQDSA